VLNESPSARLISFDNGFIEGGASALSFAGGSCSVRDCQIAVNIAAEQYYAQNVGSPMPAVIALNGSVPQFELLDAYNEVHDDDAAREQSLVGQTDGAWTPAPIAIRNCTFNSQVDILQFSGLQPILIENSVLGTSIQMTREGPLTVIASANGNGTANPPPPQLYPCRSSVGYTGWYLPIGRLPYLNALDTPVPVMVLGGYDVTNPPSLAVASAPASAGTIRADVHVIASLTTSRVYSLSSDGVQNGSRLRVSRLGSTDGNFATVEGVQLGGATGQVAWAEWIWSGSGAAWRLFASGTAP
jgi:hypothetical protein